jgi:hypothetical protein
MSDRPALSTEEIVRKAAQHAGLDPLGGEALDMSAAALGDIVDGCICGAMDFEGAWTVHPEAKLRWLRRPLARILAVFSDRQREVDRSLVLTVTSLAEYCRVLEHRVESLEARLESAGRGADEPADGAEGPSAG